MILSGLSDTGQRTQPWNPGGGKQCLLDEERMPCVLVEEASGVSHVGEKKFILIKRVIKKEAHVSSFEWTCVRVTLDKQLTFTECLSHSDPVLSPYVHELIKKA